MWSRTLNKKHQIIILVVFFSLLLLLPLIIKNFNYVVLLDYLPLTIGVIASITLFFFVEPTSERSSSKRSLFIFGRIVTAQIIFCGVIFILCLLSLPVFFPKQPASTYADLYLSASVPSYLYGAGHPWSVLFVLLLMVISHSTLKEKKISRLLSQTLGIAFPRSLSSAIDLQCLMSVFVFIFIFISFYTLYSISVLNLFINKPMNINFFDCVLLLLFYRICGHQWLLKLTRGDQNLGWPMFNLLWFSIGGLFILHELRVGLEQLFNWHLSWPIHSSKLPLFKYWLIYYWAMSLLAVVCLFIYLQQLSNGMNQRLFILMSISFPLSMGFGFYFIIFGFKLGKVIIFMPHILELKQVITRLFSEPYYHGLVNFGMVLFIIIWIKSNALNINLYRFAPNVNEKQARRLRQLLIKLFELIPCFLILIVSGWLFGLLIVVFLVMIAAICVFILFPSFCFIYATCHRIFLFIYERGHFNGKFSNRS